VSGGRTSRAEMEIWLAPARVLDAGRLGALMGETNRRLPWLPKVHSGAEDIAHIGRMIDAGWVTVAHGEDGILGFLARDGQVIHALYLRSEMQGRGIARRLMEAAKQETDRLELRSYEANARAKRFYRKAGFREVGRSDGAGNDAGLPDIRFEWQREKT
jgi:GNAT superfamily N-acetyltransferase